MSRRAAHRVPREPRPDDYRPPTITDRVLAAVAALADATGRAPVGVLVARLSPDDPRAAHGVLELLAGRRLAVLAARAGEPRERAELEPRVNGRRWAWTRVRPPPALRRKKKRK